MKVAAGGLERYRAAARAVFLAKADVGLPDERLAALPSDKRTFAVGATAELSERVATWLGDPTVEIEFQDDRGTFHALFRVETSSGRLWARTSVPVVPWPALDFLVGEWGSRTLPGLGVPVAETVLVDLSRDELPFDLELVEHKHGSAFPPGPGGEAAARALGACLARLHGVRCDGWGPIDPGSLHRGSLYEGSEDPRPRGLHQTWATYLLLRLDEHLAACIGSGALTTSQAADAGDAIERSVALAPPGDARLLHGDLGNPNVLIDKGRITALLDWEDALAGDAAFDIAGWGTFVGNHPRLDALLEGYREVAGPAAPGEAFELRYWLYVLRIMLAKTVHRHRFGYSRSDRIPPSERLLPALEALQERLAEAG